MVKTYSQASTSTVFLDHWDYIMTSDNQTYNIQTEDVYTPTAKAEENKFESSVLTILNPAKDSENIDPELLQLMKNLGNSTKYQSQEVSKKNKYSICDVGQISS